MKKTKLILALLALLPLSRLFAQTGEIIYRDFDPDSILIYWLELGPVWIDLDVDGEADDLMMQMWKDNYICAPFLVTGNPNTMICIAEPDSIDVVLSEVEEENWMTDFIWDGGDYPGRHDHYGFRIQRDDDYYYGWFETYNRVVSEKNEKQISHFGFDRTAYCTIPNYPLRWGQTNIVGIEENDESDIFAAIHPNPTTGFVTVTGENLRQAEVINMLGQQVHSVRGNGNELHINMATLPAGIYFVTVIDEDGRKCVRKVVKE